jgi:hypothetical protein
MVKATIYEKQLFSMVMFESEALLSLIQNQGAQAEKQKVRMF